MDKIEEEFGYEVTFNPFAEEEMAGFVAKKTDQNGTTMITLSPSSGDFDDDENHQGEDEADYEGYGYNHRVL